MHSPHHEQPGVADTQFRRAAMAICAQATRHELAAVLGQLRFDGAVEDVRKPEIGLVMVRGRIGGDGRAFNVGEATVSRATVRLPSGEIGFSWQLGRDLAKARLAAVLDALWQVPEQCEAVEAGLSAVAARIAAQHRAEADRIAATKVDFFTLVRGDD